MGVNTDGEEVNPETSLRDDNQYTTGFRPMEHEREHAGSKESFLLDDDCTGGIQDPKLTGATDTSISPQKQMSLQNRSVVSIKEKPTPQEDNTHGGDVLLSNQSDKQNDMLNSNPVFVATCNSSPSDDMCAQRKECKLQPFDITKILDTDINDAWENWDKAYKTLLDETFSIGGNGPTHELPLNPYVDKVDNEGYTRLYKAALVGDLKEVEDLVSQGANLESPSKGGLQPLHAAAKEGHADIVDFLILHGVDPSVECEMGQTPLHRAAVNGHICIIESLIAEGVDVNKADNMGWTSFNAAVQYGYLEAVKYLIDKGARQNRYAGMTPLNAATQFGHLDIVKFFISNGADVNEEDDEEMVPLYVTAFNGNVKIMQYLVQQGSDVNKADQNGRTSFHAAIQEGHIEAVKYLIDKGAKQNRYDGMTPLFAAAEFGHLEIVKFFISIGADVNEENYNGKIPLHGAAINGNIKIIEYLVLNGSDVNRADYEGWTPFNAAIQYGHLEAVKFLIHKGAKQNRYDGMTPLYAAAEFGHLDIVKFFISNGADVNEEHKEGMIPLHGAASGGHINVLRYLINNGSDIHKASTNGWTPSNAAVQYGHLEAVIYLLSVGARKERFLGRTPLITAVRFGHLKIVEYFISTGADVTEEDDQGKTLLHHAAAQGHTDIMKYLIKNGSDVNKCDAAGLTPLNATINCNHPDALKILLDEGSELKSSYDRVPLYTAALCGYLDVIKILISNGADVNEDTKQGEIPLHAASSRGHIEVMEYLIQHGSVLNKEDSSGFTPFNAAVQCGQLDAIRYLVSKGATQNRFQGMTSLTTATRYGHLDVVRYIYSMCGGKEKADEKDSAAPLVAAAANGSKDIMEFLIQKGYDVNKGSIEGWTPLNEAVKHGNLEAMRYLISKGAKHSRCNGITPLYTASRFGHLQVIKFLVSELGVDVNVENDGGRIALHGAAINGNVKIIKYLIQCGSNVNGVDDGGSTPSHVAIQYGNLKALKYLISKGSKNNKCNGITPLYTASRFSHLHVIKFLMSELGEDVNVENDDGRIPLHGAAIGGNVTIIEYLIQYGSDLDRVDVNGFRPFDVAVQCGNIKTIKYLTENGAMQSRINGRSPLHVASFLGNLDVVKFFISNGTDVNEEDNKGITPLHLAASRGHIEVVEYLHQQGCNINKNTFKGWTPLHAAVQNGHLEVVKFLITKAAKVSKYNGLTPLYIATQSDHVPVVKFFVSKGYDVNERNENGKSPVHAACYNGSIEIVECFLQQYADFNQQDHCGWTPFAAAEQEKHKHIIDYLSARNDMDLIPQNSTTCTSHSTGIDKTSSDTVIAVNMLKEGPYSGTHQVSVEGAETQSHERQFSAPPILIDDRSDCTRYDTTKRKCSEGLLKNHCMNRMGGDDDSVGQNPFEDAKPKSPDKFEEHSIRFQMETSNYTMARKRRTRHKNTYKSSSLETQQSQFNGFGLSTSQYLEDHGEILEDSEARCASSTDQIGRTIVTPGNDCSIPESSLESNRISKSTPSPSPIVNQNISHVRATSTNTSWKILLKHRESASPTITVILQTLLKMILALAVLLARCPIHVGADGTTEEVTLLAGSRGVVPFYFTVSSNDTFLGLPYYVIRLESQRRPFCVNGEHDAEGFKDQGQLPRFTTNVVDLDTSHCVNLTIDNVQTLDQDGYIFKAIFFHSVDHVQYETVKKNIVVQIPHGPAKCFITVSDEDDDEFPYEVHCRASSGSAATSLSCYHNGQKLHSRNGIADDGLVTRGIFFLPFNTHFACCSHEVTSIVSAATCNDFEWPPRKPFADTTTRIASTLPKSVNTTNDSPLNIATSTATQTCQMKYAADSAARRPFICPSLLYLSLWSYFSMHALSVVY